MSFVRLSPDLDPHSLSHPATNCRTTLFFFVAAWVFVGLVTLLDTGFAWVYAQSFSEWEMNPLAVVLARWAGIHGVLGFRLFSVACCFLVIGLARKQIRTLATSFITLVHAGLLMVYIVGFAR